MKPHKRTSECGNVIIGIKCELKVWNNSRVCPRLALVNRITALKTRMNGLYRRFLTFWIQRLCCPTQYLKATPQNLGVLIYYFNHNSVCDRSFNNSMFFSKKQLLLRENKKKYDLSFSSDYFRFKNPDIRTELCSLGSNVW